MVSAIAKLFGSFVSLLADLARSVLEWLRVPENRRRLVLVFEVLLVLFLIVLLVLVFVLYGENRTVVVVKQERDAAIAANDAARLRIGELEATVESYREQEARFAYNARREAAELERQQRENSDVKAEIETARKAAERSSKAWWRGYESRPDTCKAAQEALDVACASLGTF